MAPKQKPIDITKVFTSVNEIEEQAGDQSNARDELLLKIIDEIYSTDNIAVKTDLNKPLIKAFTKAELYHEKFGSDLLMKLVDRMAVYLVSSDRKSRKEFTEIAKSVGAFQQEEALPPSLTGRLFGRE